MKKDLKELISYVFVGGCTTLINFVIYWFVITMMDQGWLFANVISWVGAVIFAFWANKHFVFKSANETGKVVVSVITVVSNYGLCKFKIFAAKGGHEYGQN